MQDDVLRAAVCESIMLEMSRWKKEDVPREKALDSIERYVGSNSYLHYSDINKLGINPRSEFKTPIGVYGYVLSPAYVEQLRSNRAPEFARDRKYAHVFKSREPETVLNMQSYTKERHEEDVAELRRRMPNKTWALAGQRAVFDQVDARARQTAFVKTPGGMIWNLTRLLADGEPRRWTSILSKALAYTGVRDDGAGIIHENEPTQAVFFDPRTIEQVATFDNSVTTFSTTATDSAVSRFMQAKERLFYLTRKMDDKEKVQALRARIIDPFTRHPSADVRYKAIPQASPAAIRAALKDPDEDVRREALSSIQQTKAVIKIMVMDKSPKIVDDVLDMIPDVYIDEGDDGEVTDMLRQVHDRWIDKDPKIARRAQDMLDELT